MFNVAEDLIPETWSKISLSTILRVFESGRRPKGGVKRIKSGVPSIGGEHLTSDGKFNFDEIRYIPHEFYKRMTRGIIEKGDILIVKDGATTGKTSIIRSDFVFEKAAVNEHVFIARTFQDINNLYLFYYLYSPYGQDYVKKNFKGTAQGGINLSFADETYIPIPPLPEQHRIVAKIEELFAKLDAGVEALKKIKVQLKRYRQAVLKYAFEGKLTEEWRRANEDKLEPISVLLERIDAERVKIRAQQKRKSKDEIATPSARNDNLPELPEGWMWIRIGKISEVVRGASPRPAGSPKYFGGTIPWITVGEITKDTNVYLTKVNSYLTEEGKNKSRYIDAGTFLITNSGATLGIPKITTIAGCINDGSVALLGIEANSKLFLYYFLLTKVNDLRQINQGAAQPNLNTAIIKNIFIPFPTALEQYKIVKEIESRFSITDKIEKNVDTSLEKAERLRRSILKRSFEGKLVPQDPSDEPAEKLLERIKAEKARSSRKNSFGSRSGKE